jgi:DNA primase
MAQDDIKEEIRARVDLVELIGQYVRLERAGRRQKGLCPFHQEKTPSFFVDPERGFWHCFGCGEGGDVFSFVMRAENLSFPEAARRLAERAGLRWRTDPQAEARRERRQLLERANDIARARFTQHLFEHPSAERAREHLRTRGFSRKALEAFRVGYALDSWDDLLKALAREGIGAQVAEEAGLVRTGDRGGHYDVFRDRIIFPIADLSGRTVGFGGRALREDEPAKYLNSPETPLFRKRRTLYALDLARQAIVAEGRAVIVEGYTDVISLHQAGLRSAVAGLGTALTAEQLQMVSRYCDEVVLVYDADAAGEQAALRNLETFENAEAAVSLVALPEGMDPDDYVREHGAEGLEALIGSRVSPVEYRLKLIFDAHTGAGAQERARAAQEAVAVLMQIRDWTARDEYLGRAADLWGGNDPGRTAAMARVLKLEFARRARREERRRPTGADRDMGFVAETLTKTGGDAPPGLLKAESDLLSLALDDEHIARHICGELEPADLLAEADRAILAAMQEHLAAGKWHSKEMVDALPEEEGVRARCVELLVGEARGLDVREIVGKTVLWLKEYRRAGRMLTKHRADREAPHGEDMSVEDFHALEREVLEALNQGKLGHDDPAWQRYCRLAAQLKRSGHEGYWEVEAGIPTPRPDDAVVPDSAEPEAAEQDVPEPHEAAAELFDVGEEDGEAED